MTHGLNTLFFIFAPVCSWVTRGDVEQWVVRSCDVQDARQHRPRSAGSPGVKQGQPGAGRVESKTY